MRRTHALSAAVGLAAAVVLCSQLYQAHAQGQGAARPAQPAADPTYVQWPLPASGADGQARGNGPRGDKLTLGVERKIR